MSSKSTLRVVMDQSELNAIFSYFRILPQKKRIYISQNNEELKGRLVEDSLLSISHLKHSKVFELLGEWMRNKKGVVIYRYTYITFRAIFLFHSPQLIVIWKGTIWLMSRTFELFQVQDESLMTYTGRPFCSKKQLKLRLETNETVKMSATCAIIFTLLFQWCCNFSFLIRNSKRWIEFSRALSLMWQRVI